MLGQRNKSVCNPYLMTWNGLAYLQERRACWWTCAPFANQIVDFCCGANDFSIILNEKLLSLGKTCHFKNFDIHPPKVKAHSLWCWFSAHYYSTLWFVSETVAVELSIDLSSIWEWTQAVSLLLQPGGVGCKYSENHLWLLYGEGLTAFYRGGTESSLVDRWEGASCWILHIRLLGIYMSDSFGKMLNANAFRLGGYHSSLKNAVYGLMGTPMGRSADVYSGGWRHFVRTTQQPSVQNSTGWKQSSTASAVHTSFHLLRRFHKDARFQLMDEIFTFLTFVSSTFRRSLVN